MRMVGLGVLLAVCVEVVLIAVKHQLRGVPFSWLTFTGGICFIAAVAIHQPTHHHVGLLTPFLRRKD